MNHKEIDRLIAEKVMGWEYQDCNGDELLLPPGDVSKLQFVKKPDKHQYVKSYSTNIKDAWLVVEEVNKEYEFELYRDKHERKYVCEFTRYVEVIHIYNYRALSESAPLAICLAALKSVGVEVEG